MRSACDYKYVAMELSKNKQKMYVAIVAGGDSSEYVISVQSAEQIAMNLSTVKYVIYTVIVQGNQWYVKDADSCELAVDLNDFSFNLNGQKIKFDVAFITIHGTPGEDGKLQSYFDLMKIPYTSCNALTSALTFNKYYCNNYLAGRGILTAKSLMLRQKDKIDAEYIINTLGLPCFVKPNNGGSSFGISKVKENKELVKAINKAFKEDNEVIIEEFIEGREFTCGVFKYENGELLFPLTEIISKNEFFDYEAKYTDGLAKEITPAKISEQNANRCQLIASKIYDLINCSGIVRIDFIFSNNQFYLLEINTVPGMSKNSIIPQQAKAFGITLSELYDLIIQDTLSIVNFDSRQK